MTPQLLARRLRRLPAVDVCGHRVPVAVGPRARLLGLAHLDRDGAGGGLLIPRCRSVHTFGMRFELDLIFLDGEGEPLAVRSSVPPRRLVCERTAVAVLELPADADVVARVLAKWESEGGEFPSLRP